MKKRFRLITTLFILLFCESLHAQHWHSYNPTAWFDVNTVAIPGPGVIAIGGGQETNNATQIMFQTTNYGLTWTENAHDGLMPWNKSIAFSDSVNGYAVGDNGRIIKSDDAGMNWGWTVIPINRTLNKIIYAGAGTYYVVGGNKAPGSMQTIIKSTNYGNTWNVIRDTSGHWLKSIFFINTLKGFAIGDSGVILGTINGGNSWVTITAPVVRDFNAITFINADTGYIVGGSLSGYRTILRTANGGANWVVLKDTLNAVLNDISFASSTTGYSVGAGATVLKTINGGLTWAPLIIDTNLAGTETFNAVRFYDPAFGVIGGKAGKLYVYGDPLLPEIHTSNANVLNPSGAELHAMVNTHGEQEQYGFYYSNDSTFSSSTFTGYQNISNNSLVSVMNFISGLMPNTKYFFFAVLKDIPGTQYFYGDTLSFTTHLPYTFLTTLSASTYPNNTAILHGHIDQATSPLNIYFEYGTQWPFDHQVAASPSSVNDGLPHNFSATIGSLQPFTIYTCRLKAVSGQGTYCANTMSFSIGSITTLDPTLVPANTVIFNGTLDHATTPVQLTFEYGTSSLLGDSVIAMPASVNDTLLHNVTATMNTLQHNTLYFYRLKGVTPNGPIYGNIMCFYNGTLYTALQADSATNVTQTTATLNAHVHHFMLPAEYQLEFSTNNGNTTMVAASPFSINDTLFHSLTANISSLQPYTLYSFRVRVNVNGGTFSATTLWSNTASFYTGTLYQSFQTLAATNITGHSVTVNGYIHGLTTQANIGFEYGTTPSMGNPVTANPNNVNDTAAHFVSCYIGGLNSSTQYYYRLVGGTQAGTIDGNIMTFTTSFSNTPNVSTQNVSNLTSHSAQFNGIVNANNYPSCVKFEYGTTTSYGSEINAIPDSVFGISNTNISGYITGLSPNMTYHYRAKATSSQGTGYGNDVVFMTNMGAPVNVTTLMATGITPDSAKLNGSVNPNHTPVFIKFDYGLTTAYGNEISAIPPVSSDSAAINVFAEPHGLAAHAVHHYRVKAITATDTVYGNDMIFYTGVPEIPNFDFEIWDSTRADFPDGWTKIIGNVTKYSPGCSGNYALRIQNDPSGMVGGAMMGYVGDAIFGGVPFNARPDSIKGCFNYNIGVNDTAIVVVAFKKGGNLIAGNMSLIAGNSNGNFIEKKFPIQYNTSDIPDSLILGFVCSDMRNKTFCPTNYMIVDNIRFTGTSVNIPNHDFELWHQEEGLPLVSWNYKGRGVIPLDTLSTFGASRTTDAISNHYAVKVKTSVIQGGRISGYLKTGNDITDKFPVSIRHQSLTGYYKFFPQNGDTMILNITMYKNGNYIGGGGMMQTNTIGTYTPFSTDINYNAPDTPDSAAIYIQSFRNWPPRGASTLYVDDLNFDGFLQIGSWLGSPYTAPISQDMDFNVYPNPFNDKAYVSFTLNKDEDILVRLFDLSGKPVLLLAKGHYAAGDHKLDLAASGLSKGFYICVITTEKAVYSKKLIIY